MTHEELCRMEQPQLVKLIDEGKLIYLPCKVGDAVYYNFKPSPKCIVMSAKVFKIEFIGSTIWIYAEFFSGAERRVVNFIHNDFNKIVFFDYEEDEKVLKERAGNGK